MKKVLVVEDNDRYFMWINRGLKNKAEVSRAVTLDEGEELFRSNNDFDLIIMDACIEGDHPDAMPLVKKIVASGFSGPIIACSSLSTYSQMLIAAGATYEAGKEDAATLALKLLNL